MRKSSVAKSHPDLDRLRRAMKRADTDGEGLPPIQKRVLRNAAGRLPNKPASPIRDAVLRELGRREMTRYQLWKLARQHCGVIPESAVYEFLRGQRAISVTYCDALLTALNLRVLPLRHSA